MMGEFAFLILICFNCAIFNSIDLVQGSVWRTSKSELDPCTDFYKYACNDQSEVNLTPGGKIFGSNYLNQAKQTVDESLLRIFNTSRSQSVPYEKSWSNVQKFYRSCLQKKPDNVVKDLIRTIQKVAVFPEVNDTWREFDFDWLQVVGVLRQYGIQAIIHESVGPDWKDSQSTRVYFVAPKFDFVNKEDLLGTSRNSEEFVFFYKRYIKLFMSKLGIRIRRAREISEKIVAFETKIAQIVPEDSEIEPPESITLSQLQQRIQWIDWFKYLTVVQGTSFVSGATRVIVHEDYYRKLSTIMQAADQRTVAQYLMFKFMYKFKAVIDEEHTSKHCLQDTIEKMSESVGRIYIQSTFLNEARQSANLIVQGVKTALGEVLDESTWLDESTRKSALEKLSSLQTIIGYPEDLLSYTKEDSVVLSDDYYENCLQLARHSTAVEHEQLSEGIRPWLPSPVSTNAYYKITKNTIFIPAGLLVPPIFDMGRNNLHNYAILGSIVGHEMTHAFDFEGRNYNAKGSVANWWTTKSLIAYYSHVECILSQYNNISSAESRGTIGGFGSISENVADKGGVQVAYRAFVNWKRSLKDMTSENSSSPTDNRMFFMSFARLWCNSFDEDKNESRTHHSSNKYRVLNSLSGIPTFVDAFNCRSGSIMHPVRKCNLW